MYSLFLAFEDFKRTLQLWDDADRTLSLCSHFGLSQDACLLADRVKVDEVQDFTPAELSLVSFATGKSVDALYLAGDTAQVV